MNYIIWNRWIGCVFAITVSFVWVFKFTEMLCRLPHGVQHVFHHRRYRTFGCHSGHKHNEEVMQDKRERYQLQDTAPAHFDRRNRRRRSLWQLHPMRSGWKPQVKRGIAGQVFSLRRWSCSNQTPPRHQTKCMHLSAFCHS